jgi:hypothetical protein
LETELEISIKIHDAQESLPSLPFSKSHSHADRREKSFSSRSETTQISGQAQSEIGASDCRSARWGAVQRWRSWKPAFAADRRAGAADALEDNPNFVTAQHAARIRWQS